MKHYFKFTFFLVFQTLVINSWGQQNIALEHIQVYSSINPTATYWKLPSDMHPILNALDTGIFSKLKFQRDTNFVTKAVYLSKQNQLGKINIDWTETRKFDYHAYLE
jgi:hypothetical protein